MIEEDQDQDQGFVMQQSIGNMTTIVVTEIAKSLIYTYVFFHVPGPTKTSGGAALPGKRKETVLLGNKRTVVPVVPVVPVVFAVFVEFVEFVLV